MLVYTEACQSGSMFRQVAMIVIKLLEINLENKVVNGSKQ